MPKTNKQMPSYPLRERRKLKTREALMQAATELFARDGYEQTMLESVAEKAQLHTLTLYRHFPNKESLAVVVDCYWFDRFKDLVESRDRQA